jgi:hypothetical protein
MASAIGTVASVLEILAGFAVNHPLMALTLWFAGPGVAKLLLYEGALAAIKKLSTGSWTGNLPGAGVPGAPGSGVPGAPGRPSMGGILKGATGRHFWHRPFLICATS